MADVKIQFHLDDGGFTSAHWPLVPRVGEILNCGGNSYTITRIVWTHEFLKSLPEIDIYAHKDK